MDLFSFSCGICGEFHKKYLPSTTNRTTCHKCGNLIEISSKRNILDSNKRNHINFSNNRNNKIKRNNFFISDSDSDYDDNSSINNNLLENDFYDFNRYSGHNDYLQNVENTKNSQDDLSELNDNIFMDEFDRFYSGNILNNNQQSRPLKLSNTRYNFSNINQEPNRPFQRLNQRSFSTNQSSNNINKNTIANKRYNAQNNNIINNINNNQNNGMFSIQIPNDHYDRYSALHHRSNFGYMGEDRRIHNFDDFDDLIQHEIEYDLEMMSRRNEDNPIRRSIGLVGSLVVKPEKPKIKLEKIKMNKSLYTKNDGNKNEAPSCCICLTPMKINQDVTLLKCQHLFHYNCLDKWVENKEVCPFCRGKIEFAKINQKGKDKKEDEKVENHKSKNNNINSSNFNIINKNISVRPVIGERKTNIIRSNNSIFNSSNINKKNKKEK